MRPTYTLFLSTLAGVATTIADTKSVGLATATADSAFTGGTVANDLLDDTTCRSYYLVIARASTEEDNIGETVGPALCEGLQKDLGASEIGCQGIGDAQGYTAALDDNIPTYDGGILTSTEAVTGATALFTNASTSCPDSLLVATGYSQGTAVMYNSVGSLSSDVQSKVLGVALFGYTGNVPNKGEIPNYPASQTVVYCSNSVGDDGVCTASEIDVNAAHLDYTSRFDDGIAFLKGIISNSTATAKRAAKRSPMRFEKRD